jgi:N-acetylneuraminic acid mutarotase
MKPFEPRRLSLLLCLLLACTPSSGSSSNDDDDGQVNGQREPHGSTASMAAALASSIWKVTANLGNLRSGHTATLLPNGKVLVVGGYRGYASELASAELYDPATGTWSFTGSLAQGRQEHTATLLPNGKVLVVGGKKDSSPLGSAEVYDPATGVWSPVASLTHARFGHSALVLDGKLLVLAGNDGTSALASAEVYDPATGAWSSAGALAQAREHHTATLLPGGKVLVVGGRHDGKPLVSAEVYDPSGSSPPASSSVGPLAQAREYHTATLLTDGRVLVAGGRSADDSSLVSTEVYDPVARTWSPKDSLKQARERHSAVLLPGGKLLVVGGFVKLSTSSGSVSSAEIYDPLTKTWSSASSLQTARFDFTATLLPGGRVLVAGGKVRDSTGIVPEAITEVYTPAAGAWAPAGALSQGRRDHTTTLLPDGKLLVVGGRDRQANVFATVDVYDTAKGTWSSTSALKLQQARDGHTATLLLDGRVLVVGGYGGGAALASTEVYDPSSTATGTWSFAERLQQARYGHTATLLPDGRVLVVGGYGGGAALASAEVYDPLQRSWSFTGPLKQARDNHTATLLPDGKVLVVGGRQDYYTPLSSAELYDPLTGEWSTARPMPRAHFLHAATLLVDGKVLVTGGVDGSRHSLAFTEVYDPDSGAWSPAGSLNAPRSQHTATLLPGGRVLVVGGSGSSFSSPAPEVYDPATGLWFSAGALAQAREHHTATLLPGGKVLVVGGIGISDSTERSSAELYQDSTGDETWRPVLTGVSPSLLEHGTSVTVTGAHFRGGSEANGGNGRSSSTNHPLLSLSSVETGRWVPLFGHDFSDTSVSATLPYVPNGYYLLHVTTQGLTSSRMISILNRTPPDTTLDSATPAPVTRSTAATFTFSSVEGASFECNLDGAGFSTCASPLRYSILRDGDHLFQVRARDPAGSEDPAPAEYRWTVDTTPPETWMVDTESTPQHTHDTSAHLSFSTSKEGTSEEGASFECGLDGVPTIPCSNPQDYSGLPEGEHVFQVKATDRAGNTDPTEAEYRWTVDTTPPQRPEILVPTPNQQFFTSQPILSGKAEAGSTVRVFVDGVQAGEDTANEGGYWELDSSQLNWGSHQATATAIDPAGNTSAASLEVAFATVQRGYYGMSCAAVPSLASSWPYVLLALGLLRRRRSP